MWAIRHNSKSLVLRNEMQAAETEIQRVSVTHSYRCGAATASDVSPVDGPFTARCTLLADIMAQSPTVLDE